MDEQISFYNIDFEFLEDLEKQILASCTSDAKIAYSVSRILDEEDFFNSNNRLAYGVIKHKIDTAMTLSTKAEINPTVLQLEFSERKLDIDLVKLLDYVSDDEELIVSYANTLKELALKQRFEQSLAKITIKGKPLMESVNATKDIINTIEASIVRNTPAKSIYDGSLRALEYLESTDRPKLYTFGIPALDEINVDLSPGNTIVIGARPSVGKSSIAAYIAAKNATEGIPVHFFSLEMSELQLVSKFLNIFTGISSKDILKKNVTDDEKRRLRAAVNTLKNIPIRFTSYPDMPMIALSQMIRESKLKYGTEVFIVDYLQLVRYEGRKRNEEVAYVAQQLKSLALETNSAIIELSQISRNDSIELEMDMLKESGDIEQAASLIALMWEDQSGSFDALKNQDIQPLWFKVAKQRNGEKGSFLLAFNKTKMNFALIGKDKDLEKEKQQEKPQVEQKKPNYKKKKLTDDDF